MPDDSALLHAGEIYNPAKAHDYYLRTRDLKGRGLGVTQTSVARTKSGALSLVPTVKTLAVTPITTSKKRQDDVNARVADLRQRLDKLKVALNKMIKQAKDNAKSSGPSKKSTDSSKSTKTSDLSTKQKRDAAVRSKASYERNKKTTSSVDKWSEADIAEVRAKIHKIREQLKAAVTNARDLSTKPAKQKTTKLDGLSIDKPKPKTAAPKAVVTN